MENDEERIRKSTMYCIKCLRLGVDSFMNFQKWGGGDIRFTCPVCAYNFELKEKDMKRRDDSPAGIEGSRG